MFPESINNLIESFKYLPGIGEKTAERFAFSILELDDDQVEIFRESLNDVKEKLEKRGEIESDNDDIEAEEKGIRKAFNKIEDEKQGEQKPQRMISAEAKEAMYDKPTWSEEDEEMFDGIIADIQFSQKAHNHEVDQIVYEREIDWLKSLKERIGG